MPSDLVIRLVVLLNVFPWIIPAEVSLSINPTGTKIGRVGEDMSLLCVIEESNLESNLTPELPTDLIWYRGDEKLKVERVSLPGNLSLNLRNPQFQDSDLYSCGAEDYGLLEMVSVRFGVPPSEPNSSERHSTNSLDALVSWKTQYNDTNLPTIYKFEYKTRLESGHCPGNDELFPCPEKREDSCFLKNHYSCHDITYRITATNSLGIAIHEFQPFQTTDITIPNPPENLTHTFNGLWEIRWKIPSDWPHPDLNELWYHIQYWSEEESLEDAITTDSLEETYYQIKNDLDPLTWYHVKVVVKYKGFDDEDDNAEANDGWSEPVIGNFHTEEVQPSGPFSFNITEVTLSLEDPEKVNVFLMWQPLSKKESGGIINGYNISILLDGVHDWNILLNNTGETEYVIREQLDKINYNNYVIQMAAFNMKGSTKPDTKNLLDYPLPSTVTRTNENDIIVAVAVVFISLITIAFGSLLFRYIYNSIKEANTIPDVPSTITSQLTQDLDGYMVITGNNGQPGIAKEAFDILITETEEVLQLNFKESIIKYEKHIEKTVVLPISPDTQPDCTEVQYSKYIPTDKICEKEADAENIVNQTGPDPELVNIKKEACDIKKNENHLSTCDYISPECAKNKDTSDVEKYRPPSSFDKNKKDSILADFDSSFPLLYPLENISTAYQPHTTPPHTSNAESMCAHNGYIASPSSKNYIRNSYKGEMQV